MTYLIFTRLACSCLSIGHRDRDEFVDTCGNDNWVTSHASVLILLYPWRKVSGSIAGFLFPSHSTSVITCSPPATGATAFQMSFTSCGQRHLSFTSTTGHKGPLNRMAKGISSHSTSNNVVNPMITGWWFQPLWEILVSWDYYHSQYMEK